MAEIPYKIINNANQIPRCLQISEETEELTYHLFNDASEKTCESVVYQQSIYKYRLSTQLVLSKSRVAPLKTTSTPRLELLGASLGLKLAKKIIDMYEIKI